MNIYQRLLNLIGRGDAKKGTAGKGKRASTKKKGGKKVPKHTMSKKKPKGGK